MPVLTLLISDIELGAGGTFLFAASFAAEKQVDCTSLVIRFVFRGFLLLLTLSIICAFARHRIPYLTDFRVIPIVSFFVAKQPCSN